jgi:hypothetical protein
MIVELLKGQVSVAVINRVLWGTRSTFVAILSNFWELESELELFRSGHNVNLTEDQADALWPWVRVASDSLALHIPPSVAHNPPNGMGE